MRKVPIWWGTPTVEDLLRELEALKVRQVLLVCDPALPHLRIAEVLKELEKRGLQLIHFEDFAPNPAEESVTAGTALLQESHAQMVWGIGGGSAMDVAKCIRLRGGELPLWLMPTTAGTGSEADHFAVIYRAGVKQSVTDERLYPDLAILDPSVLESLPLYQKKATLLDAICHGVESIWSLRSTAESRDIAGKALALLLRHAPAYLAGDSACHRDLMWAAHLAGQAIDRTTTTAGHAMCYKLTGLYGLAHGHAAALCVDALWPWMLAHPQSRSAALSEAEMALRWQALAEAFGTADTAGAAERFHALLTGMNLPRPDISPEALQTLCASVNPERLANHPWRLTPVALETLYRSLSEEGNT